MPAKVKNATSAVMATQIGTAASKAASKTQVSLSLNICIPPFCRLHPSNADITERTAAPSRSGGAFRVTR
jgi:hypothetical protein